MRHAGAAGNEDVGISNDNGYKNTHTENPRFPQRRSPSEGKPGPKSNPRGADDGQAVKIPLPPIQDRLRPRSDTAAC